MDTSTRETITGRDQTFPAVSVWPDLAVRDLRPEVMDDPRLDRRLHDQALRGLSRLNHVAGVHRLVWKSLEECCRESQLERPSVLDLACGSGDLLIWLSRRARSSGLALQLTGCDVSEVALESARGRAEACRVNADFFQMDVLTGALPESHDFVVSSLFLHHLEEVDVVKLLQRMAKAARYGVIVQDLLRTRLGYLLCWFSTRLLTRSPVVKVDGPLSVAGAFTIAEIGQLADQAGLTDCQIDRHWPERFVLTWKRPSPRT